MAFDAGQVSSQATLDLAQWTRAQAQLQRDVQRLGQTLTVGVGTSSRRAVAAL
jgi:hypothetical protein